MDQYQFEQHLQTVANNYFQLNSLIQSNILKEMWNLLSIEDKKNFARKFVDKIGSEFCVRSITGTIPYDKLFDIIDKEALVSNLFKEKQDELLKQIKDATLLKIISLCNNIGNDSYIHNLILPEIHKIVKNCYQNILSFHGDEIIKHAKALIIRVSAEESILKYGSELMKKAKKLVEEELIKDQLE